MTFRSTIAKINSANQARRPPTPVRYPRRPPLPYTKPKTAVVSNRRTPVTRPVTNLKLPIAVKSDHALVNSWGTCIPLVSIIIPMYNSRQFIKEQIIKWDTKDDGVPKEIIYVDDRCPQESFQEIRRSWAGDIPNLSIKVVRNSERVGYGTACNYGAAYAAGKYLIFLNADTVVEPNWVKPMIDLLEKDKGIGLVGNLQVHGDDVDSAGSEWLNGYFGHIGKHVYHGQTIAQPFKRNNMPPDLRVAQERQMVTGCCFAISAELWEKLGGYDEGYRIGYWEDADLCMRVRAAGYKVFYQPDSVIHHHGHHSNATGHPSLNANKELFYSKWVKDGKIEIKHRPLSPIIPKQSIVVYTAITNGYDPLRSPPVTARGVDFVAYLDETGEPSPPWNVRKLEPISKDHNRNAKQYKILPHRFFPEKEYSLWIDGSAQIAFQFSVGKLIEKYLNNADIALFKHFARDCIYDEAEVCKHDKLDDPRVIDAQMQRYRSEGYPAHAGLVEATILLRRHTPKIIEFNEAWWKEICNGSRRDQLSFNYVARKLGLVYNYFPATIYTDNGLFARTRHAKSCPPVR